MPGYAMAISMLGISEMARPRAAGARDPEDRFDEQPIVAVASFGIIPGFRNYCGHLRPLGAVMTERSIGQVIDSIIRFAS